MCDPTLLIGSAVGGTASKLISNSEATNNANRQAAAANAVLQDTLGREKGFQASNTTELNKNLDNYAPGAQDAQLKTAQDARAGTSTGNMTTTGADSVPISSDAPPAVRSAIAARMLAAHDGAVDRATKSGALGGYGDSMLDNQLHTAEADRNIGVTNNFANGQKAILPALQQDAMAAAYKAPSIWSTILGGGSQIAAGAAGNAGKAASASPVGTMQVGDQFFPAFG